MAIDLARARSLGVRLTLAASAVVLTACGDETATPIANDDLQEIQADNVIYGMVSFLTANGIREGRVEADTAYMFADSAMAKLRQMKIVFYNENGTERATVTGTSGEWDQNTDRMVARGDVVLIVNADGRRIESQEIFYDPNRDRIWSDSATVQIEADGRVTRGSAFLSDMEFRNIRISDIRGGIVF